MSLDPMPVDLVQRRQRRQALPELGVLHRLTGGDPYYATLFMPLLIYEEAFDRFRFGPGAAMMLIVVLMTLYFISTLYTLFKSGGYTDETA